MSMPGGMPSGYNSGLDDGASTPGERGWRRKKLAAMAGSLYRTGQQAVTDMKEQYAQSRVVRDAGGSDGHGRTHIPGAFPDVAITVQGDDQMVLFPSYAKRHIKKDWGRIQAQQSSAETGGVRDEEYWRQEWERNEDEKAVLDVDVRGWIYNPHMGPMTRRNRMLIGLARQLSGIPAPRNDPPAGNGVGALGAHHQMHEDLREQEKIKREAAKIERRGQEEKQAAYRGDYSEKPRDNTDFQHENVYGSRSRRGSQTPDSAPTSPTFSATAWSTSTGQMSEAELTMANANLMARIAPFMTNPLVAHPITVFFYSDDNSQSRTVITNDAGHFNLRAALDFVPTHVRVLANEDLSAIQEIKIIEPHGVSLISDVDDTIKTSNISGGAREIFRNTFVRNLQDLTVDGVKEWYNQMYDLGVSIHYCSNSPWQLFPVLATYFKLVGLPPGSLHLRQYSGMLQGIFEPVAERKKGTLNRLLNDFPNRKFILVGDSGEADLEVYTELVLANPGRVLAVFIRDVTTPEAPGFFDSGFEMPSRKGSNMTFDDARTQKPVAGVRQNSAPGVVSNNKTSTGPAMGTLIDFSDEPEETSVDLRDALRQINKDKPISRQVSATELLAAKRPPPPRPAKPMALRSTSSIVGKKTGSGDPGLHHDDTLVSEEPPPKPPRPGAGAGKPGSHPLAQMHNSSQQTVSSSNSVPRSQGARQANTPAEARDERPPPPPPRRRAVPTMKSMSPRLRGYRNNSSANSDIDFEPLGPSAVPTPVATSQVRSSRSSTRSAETTPTGSPTLGAVNKKLELWKRRLTRAHEVLDQQGVQLYTWKRGQDVVAEATGIVRSALEDVERQKRSGGGRR